MGVSLDKGVKWRLDGSYRQVPHLFSLIARSPYTDLGRGTFGLSDSLQRRNQDDPAGYIDRMNAELAVAPGFPLEHRTDVLDGRLRFRPDKGWQLGGTDDGLFDDQVEFLKIALPADLTPGVHTLAIRIADGSGNISSTSTSFQTK